MNYRPFIDHFFELVEETKQKISATTRVSVKEMILIVLSLIISVILLRQSKALSQQNQRNDQ